MARLVHSDAMLRLYKAAHGHDMPLDQAVDTTSLIDLAARIIERYRDDSNQLICGDDHRRLHDAVYAPGHKHLMPAGLLCRIAACTIDAQTENLRRCTKALRTAGHDVPAFVVYHTT